MPLSPDAQSLFTTVSTTESFLPTRVRQGVLNVKAYFREAMQSIPNNLIRKMCVQEVDCAIVGRTEDGLVIRTRVSEVLSRVECGLYALQPTRQSSSFASLLQ